MNEPRASRNCGSVVLLFGAWAGLYLAESLAASIQDLTRAGAKLSVACPQSETDEPRFRNDKTGKTFRINDPRHRAVAAKACQAEPNLGDTSANVDLVNQRSEPVFVSFTLSDHSPGPIQWGRTALRPVPESGSRRGKPAPRRWRRPLRPVSVPHWTRPPQTVSMPRPIIRRWWRRFSNPPVRPAVSTRGIASGTTSA